VSCAKESNPADEGQWRKIFWEPGAARKGLGKPGGNSEAEFARGGVRAAFFNFVLKRKKYATLEGSKVQQTFEQRKKTPIISLMHDNYHRFLNADQKKKGGRRA